MCHAMAPATRDGHGEDKGKVHHMRSSGKCETVASA